MTQAAIVWLRNDLRLADNPALTAAVAEGGEVIPVYILDDAAAGVWRPGGAARWWLHGSLASLQAGLGGLGLRLRLLGGDSVEQIDRLVAETGAATVLWNRRYEPWAIAQDKAIKAGLEGRGIRARSFNGSLGREPWEVQRSGGEPCRVFTPFWRAWMEHGALPAPLPAPGPVGERVEPDHEALAALGLLPTAPNWAAGLRETWQPGEPAAWAELDAFVDGRIGGYKAARDFPAEPGVSRLSPRLHHGELSPRQIWHRAQVAVGAGAEAFLRQLVWREFAHHLLFHFPQLPETPLRPEFARFPVRPDGACHQ